MKIRSAERRKDVVKKRTECVIGLAYAAERGGDAEAAKQRETTHKGKNTGRQTVEDGKRASPSDSCFGCCVSHPLEPR